MENIKGSEVSLKDLKDKITSYDRRHGTLLMSNTYKFYYQHVKNGGEVDTIEPLLSFNKEGMEILEEIKSFITYIATI